MTHTLHRLGNRANLHEDFVVFTMSAKGINEEGSHKAMRCFMELAFEMDPVNAGDSRTGNIFTLSRQEILDGITDTSVVHAVFTEEKLVTLFLNRLRQADLGLSVIVSGLFDQVLECAKQVDLRQHTVECSLGVWGRIERLPKVHIMQVTTMCGHGLISEAKVERLGRDIHRGLITAEEASTNLARTCICGIFNPVRANRIFNDIAFREGKGEPVTAGQTSA